MASRVSCGVEAALLASGASHGERAVERRPLCRPLERAVERRPSCRPLEQAVERRPSCLPLERAVRSGYGEEVTLSAFGSSCGEAAALSSSWVSTPLSGAGMSSSSRFRNHTNPGLGTMTLACLLFSTASIVSAKYSGRQMTDVIAERVYLQSRQMIQNMRQKQDCETGKGQTEHKR